MTPEEWSTNASLYILVIAHPDDESMFFYPTIFNLLQQHHQQQQKHSSFSSSQTKNIQRSARTNAPSLHILCLSNGNYDSLGYKRQIELMDAARILGISVGGVTVINDDRLQDDPHVDWDPIHIHNVVWNHTLKLVVQQQQKQSRNNITPTNNKNDNDDDVTRVTIISFDHVGVSHHANHISTWRGIQHLISQRATTNNRQPSPQIHIRAYALQSVSNAIRKYIPVLDWFILMLSYLYTQFRTIMTTTTNSNNNNEVLFYAMNPIRVYRAMKAHESQFVWYRKLSVWFSRYTYVNTLVEVIPLLEKAKKVE